MKLLSAVETVQDWQQRIRLIEKAQRDDRQLPIDLNLSGKWIDKVLGQKVELTDRDQKPSSCSARKAARSSSRDSILPANNRCGNGARNSASF